jgi:hypothetical protein
MGSCGFFLTPLSAIDVPWLEVRGDDLQWAGSSSLLRRRPNDGKIYATLWDLSLQKGRSIGDDTRAIRVGYTELRKCSGCSTRALGRAWPRLLAWGLLVSLEPHEDREPALYRVRSLGLVDTLYMDAGCTHFRILVGGKIQPFKAKPVVKEEVA